MDLNINKQVILRENIASQVTRLTVTWLNMSVERKQEGAEEGNREGNQCPVEAGSQTDIFNTWVLDNVYFHFQWQGSQGMTQEF